MKNIEFFCKTETFDSIPHPKPASQFVPSWFKELPSQLTEDITDPGSAKNCLPFLDSFTSGYIIPLWEDVYIVTGKDESIDKEIIYYKWPANIDNHHNGVVSNHSYEQIAGSPISKTPLGHAPLKFNSPWSIRTPKGYSCLITMPFNRNDQPFQIFTGIVDTDNYTAPISFPFVFLENQFDDILRKGTPLVQVIPFKRDNWKSTILPLTGKNKRMVKRCENLIRGVFRKGYRKYFWHKKKFI